MNAGLHLKQLGHEVTVVSKVGNDTLGQELLEFVDSSGLDTSYISTDISLPTSEVIVHLEHQTATYEICEPVAWDNLEMHDALDRAAKDSGLIIYGSLASRNPVSREVILHILSGDAVKLIDVNLRKPYDNKEILELLMQRADIIKMNEEELCVFGRWYERKETDRELILWLSSFFNARMVCVTRGEKGAILYAEGSFYEHPGFRIYAVDPVGAGDAFLAGLVASVLEGKNNSDALNFACATGAFVASKAGATPKYNLAEIASILNQ